MQTNIPCLRINPVIYKFFLWPYINEPGKPSGDYGPPETKNRIFWPDTSQTAYRQALLKSRSLLAPELRGDGLSLGRWLG